MKLSSPKGAEQMDNLEFKEAVKRLDIAEKNWKSCSDVWERLAWHELQLAKELVDTLVNEKRGQNNG